MDILQDLWYLLLEIINRPTVVSGRRSGHPPTPAESETGNGGRDQCLSRLRKEHRDGKIIRLQVGVPTQVIRVPLNIR